MLELRLDGLSIPIDLRQLQAWTTAPDQTSNDLTIWLNLLDPRSRRNLVQLLRAPLLRDRSFGQQLLGSWTGDHLLNEVGGLLVADSSDPQQSSAALLRQTVNSLLAQRGELSSLDLLLALPSKRISLELDGVIALAEQWQQQLQRQQQAWRQLSELALPTRRARPLQLSAQAGASAINTSLSVPHRREPLPLLLWPARGKPQGTWVVLMPGLGGGGDQLNWLAAALANWGWPVVVLDHPGSDAAAMKASLAGFRPPPGAETLGARIADVNAVLAAQRAGELAPLNLPAGAPVVLMGHSLGGLTALMAAGLTPEPGLAQRCHQALKRLPLTNLSRLLQCQLGERGLVQTKTAQTKTTAPEVAAVVAFNGFGSLLWPRGGIGALEQPVLLVGGSLDLITPPLSEQLVLFGGQRNRTSRLALIEGASHFSPVRVEGEGSDLFQLNGDLVGVDPRKVQALLLQLTAEFLLSLQRPLLLSPQLREVDGVRAHVLNPWQARRWQRMLKTPAADPAAPPAHRRSP